MPRPLICNPHLWFCVLVMTAVSPPHPAEAAEPLTTWDGRHNISNIAVTLVYFVPSDRVPLPDWRERLEYFGGRIRAFHDREYQGQSTLTTEIPDQPFQSAMTTAQLRAGDGDFTFFTTLREVDTQLAFARQPQTAFPILLVLSDINWRPLDDFYRIHPTKEGWAFEGQLIDERHFPGATSGGARATYLARRGVGWGLVSADGWRVPYSGTDCVVYHEGVGHTVGLPHPDRQDGSVMSLGQYRGWLSQSWLNKDQKVHLGWKPPERPIERNDLFSTFTAVPEPLTPRPGEAVQLRMTWPEKAELTSARVRFQTELLGPWIDAAHLDQGQPPERVALATFDRATPVSYRVDATLGDGQEVELWGYFQVRSAPGELPLPRSSAARPADPQDQPRWDETIDLLAAIDTARDRVSGAWRRSEEGVESNKQFGAKLELPCEPPAEYRLAFTVRPLDQPNGLILGQRLGDRRFVVLINFVRPPGEPAASALENVDGRNVGNATTVRADLLRQNEPVFITCEVRKGSVAVSCNGREIIRWHGRPEQLSLSDYWRTPRDNALFIGAYDCRYRFERIALTPITGAANPLTPAPAED